MLSRRNWLLLSMVLLTTLAGCQGRVNKDNFEKVQNGMSEDEVTAILGKGVEQASASVPGVNIEGPGGLDISVNPGKASTKVVTWKPDMGNGMISVTFIGGKVAMKTQAGL